MQASHASTVQSSLADAAYAALRDRLVALDIPPGAAISEDDLMRELKMGRTPVREAIKRLALEDLIDIFPRRGTFASDIQITDLAAISEVRVELEGQAAALAALRLTDADMPELAGLLDELDEDVDGVDPQALMDLDARVHRFVYRRARNPYLEDALGRLLNLSMRIWHLVLDRLPDLFERVHEHRDLLLAIQERDAGRAREIAAQHVKGFEREIRAVL